MIGLVLGETQLGSLIVKKLKLLKIKFIIIDISKKKKFKNNKNSYSLSIGQLGKAISLLKKNNCNKIIFAGRVNRPNFSKLKFDYKALYHLPQIIKASKKGDAYIIKIIVKIFQKEGIKIIKQSYFNQELLLKKKIITKAKPDLISKRDIKIGKKIIHDLKTNNIGQATIVKNGNVIAIEDKRGTDFMLNRARKIMKNFRLKNKRQGILLKFPKTNQDLRIDLPTIGIKTIKKCFKLGLKGIVVKANQNILLDRAKCVNFADKKKMFILGV